MKFNQTIIIKRWRPILEEFEKILNKVSTRSFHLVKDLCVLPIISTTKNSDVITAGGWRVLKQMHPYWSSINSNLILSLMPLLAVL